MSGPAARYAEAIRLEEISADPAQEMAVSHLQRLYEDLTNEPEQKKSLFGLFGGKSSSAQRPTLGLYFWGGVGRGKTYLMDVFYDALPFSEKRRMHFHRFMRYTHQELRALQGTANPLVQVAKNFASTTKVLCFDEFFVSDITDAMILAGLLDALFKEGVVATWAYSFPQVHMYFSESRHLSWDTR